MNITNKKLALRILLKIWKSDGTLSRYHSDKKRRILQNIKANKFKKAYLKVTYGKSIGIFGKKEILENKGFYDSAKELANALEAFTEDNLIQ